MERLCLMMVGGGKMRLVGTMPGESGGLNTFETVTGDAFAIARPPMSDEQELVILAQ